MANYTKINPLPAMTAAQAIAVAKSTKLPSVEEVVTAIITLDNLMHEIDKNITRLNELLNSYSKADLIKEIGSDVALAIHGKNYMVSHETKQVVTKDDVALRALRTFSTDADAYFTKREQQVFDQKKALADKLAGTLPSSVDSLITIITEETNKIKEVK
jgi:hypothetical protein